MIQLQILTDILKVPIMWKMCRHIYDLHVSPYKAALIGEKINGPRSGSLCLSKKEVT